jgi:hypothetical protein
VHGAGKPPDHHLGRNLMRLYYMTSFKTATDYILKEHGMRFGQFDKLNDPFEFMSPSMDNPDHRLTLTYLRKIVAKTWGVICMGKHWKSPLMWAHYAKNHTGSLVSTWQTKTPFRKCPTLPTGLASPWI